MKIITPTECPTCGYPIERVNDQIFCRNTSCEAQVFGKLLHFVKTLGIKGLGPKTLEKLQLVDINHLFYLDPEDALKALGSEKVVTKILAEIESAKKASLATVLHSFGVPLIGNTAGTKLSKVVNNLDQLTTEKCKEAGLGEKATANLMEWFNTEYQELKEFLPFKFETQCSKLPEGEVICITGKLSSYKTKAEATTILTSLGYRVVDNVTKTTNYLVDEDNKNSSKRQKADEYLIPIITNLNDFIKGKTND